MLSILITYTFGVEKAPNELKKKVFEKKNENIFWIFWIFESAVRCKENIWFPDSPDFENPWSNEYEHYACINLWLALNSITGLIGRASGLDMQARSSLN